MNIKRILIPVVFIICAFMLSSCGNCYSTPPETYGEWDGNYIYYGFLRSKTTGAGEESVFTKIQEGETDYLVKTTSDLKYKGDYLYLVCSLYKDEPDVQTANAMADKTVTDAKINLRYLRYDLKNKTSDILLSHIETENAVYELKKVIQIYDAGENQVIISGCFKNNADEINAAVLIDLNGEETDNKILFTEKQTERTIKILHHTENYVIVSTQITKTGYADNALHYCCDLKTGNVESIQRVHDEFFAYVGEYRIGLNIDTSEICVLPVCSNTEKVIYTLANGEEYSSGGMISEDGKLIYFSTLNYTESSTNPKTGYYYTNIYIYNTQSGKLYTPSDKAGEKTYQVLTEDGKTAKGYFIEKSFYFDPLIESQPLGGSKVTSYTARMEKYKLFKVEDSGSGKCVATLSGSKQIADFFRFFNGNIYFSQSGGTNNKKMYYDVKNDKLVTRTDTTEEKYLFGIVCGDYVYTVGSESTSFYGGAVKVLMRYNAKTGKTDTMQYEGDSPSNKFISSDAKIDAIKPY